MDSLDWLVLVLTYQDITIVALSVVLGKTSINEVLLAQVQG